MNYARSLDRPLSDEALIAPRPESSHPCPAIRPFPWQRFKTQRHRSTKSIFGLFHTHSKTELWQRATGNTGHSGREFACSKGLTVSLL